jgi:hypothetical protein
MSTTEDRSANASGIPGTGSVDVKLEVLVVPVPDAEQAGTELPR